MAIVKFELSGALEYYKITVKKNGVNDIHMSNSNAMGKWLSIL